jgi:hypothetical protein
MSVAPKPVVGADCKGLVDPPSFIRATEASNGIVKNKRRSIDPPCNETDAPTEATNASVNAGNVAQKDGSPTTPSFSEDLSSRWCFLRRSLQALGLISSTQGNGNADVTNSDANEIFYDAMEFAREEHLVEDVTDEDEEISALRSAARTQVPGRGQSWMEPVNSPNACKRPDP